MTERLTYFSTEGNLGDAAGLTIIDTTDWADSDFEFVKALAADVEDFPDFARLMSEWIGGELPPDNYLEIFEKRFGITEDQIREHYGDI